MTHPIEIFSGQNGVVFISPTGELHSSIGEPGQAVVTSADGQSLEWVDSLGPGGALPDGWFDPTTYGARLDGVHDDLSAFNDMIADMPDEGGVIYIGEGVAWLSDTLHVYKPVHIVGCGGRSRGFSGFTVAPGKTCLSIDFAVIGPTTTSAQGARVERLTLRSQILVHGTADGSALGFGINNQFAAGDTVKLGDCYIRASNASPTRFFRATSFTALGATVGSFGLTIPSWSDTLGSTVTDSGIVWTTEAFPTVRQNSHAYAVGDRVYASLDNRLIFECVAAGTSAGSPPTEMAGGDEAPGVTVLDTFTDGGVTWLTTFVTGMYINAPFCEFHYLYIEGFTGAAAMIWAGLGIDARGQTNADFARIRELNAQYCGLGIAIAGDDASAWTIDGLSVLNMGTLQPTPNTVIAAGYTDLAGHAIHDHSLGSGTVSNLYIQTSSGRPILKNGLGRMVCLTCNQEVPLAALASGGSPVLDLGGDLTWTDTSTVTHIDPSGGRGFSEVGFVGGGTTMRVTLSDQNATGSNGFYQFKINHPGDVNFWSYKYASSTPIGWVGFQHGNQSSQNAYVLSTTQAGLDIGAGWLGFETGYMLGAPDSVTPLFDGHLASMANDRLRSALRKQGDRFRDNVSNINILEDGYRTNSWTANQTVDVGYAPWAFPAVYVTPTATPKDRAGLRQVWKCTTAGTTHATTEPTWPASPTIGVTTQSDGTATWTFHGYSPAYEVVQLNSAKAQSPYRTAAIQTTTATASQVIHDGGIVDGIDLVLPDNAMSAVRDEIVVHKASTANGGSITIESTWVRNGGAPTQIGSSLITYNLSGSTLDGTTVAHVANGNRIELQASPESADTLNWRVFRRHFEGRD